ncbi:uncharacterized protein LOC101458476 isoform X2 [Ceratitis capitata]|uniref:uncharacterized protein LOC101458476 isoform X2 n=1 Tax=Ceratitis capitata TaxID=7213 RepID=UPI000A110C0F|nr:uncharacterized protein LOC101458476 isoform X2 [Ceratitis capitata]
MGCASSTPMVATAGSEMLKAATHVAADAAKSAEHAVAEVNESVGKSLDTAKETVGTAVTGIAHDLGSVFTEKSGELDTAKNQLLERLHLGGAAGANKALEQTVASTTANHLDASALEAAARAPTPPPDLDSLKTSTPEPEIERAMANASEDTPPTPKPSIAELEKLTAEIKHTAQTTVAATVTDGAVEANKQSNAGEMSSGTTAATEPAVDMVAWLAAEKRPGTTEWEKHADHLSKTRKVSEFKGGGKFRRFGPSLQAAIKPANYHKPMENMRRTLLEDDSCYSDAYYNSHSSPQHSSASDSPRLRHARLPINGVLAANAKRMQREFATFVSNRRSGLRSLAVSPAMGRHFDYNPQRPRFGLPTPSVIGYTRSGYSTPTLVMNSELLPNPHTAGWKRGMGVSSINSPPARIGRVPTRAITSLDPSLTTNVISQPKVKSTKAFASLRAESNGRTRIFGQTRTGSPTNRRVFAKRTNSPPKVKGRLLYARSESPARGKPLKQNKVVATTKVKPLRQASTKIRLEREASIKEHKESPKAEMSANIFSLSRALSPIKIAAESHSLPHLKSTEQKVTPTASSLLQVVEQAVERAKNDGAHLDIGIKESPKVAKNLPMKNEVSVKNDNRKETPRRSQKTEKNSERKSASGNVVESNKNIVNNKSAEKASNKRENQDEEFASKEGTKKQTPSPMRQSLKSDSISSISKRRNSKSQTTTPSPMRRYSKGAITMDKEKEKNHDQQVGSAGKTHSPKNIEGDIKQGNTEEKRKLWTSASPDGRKPRSSRSIARETELNTRRNSMQSSILLSNSSPNAKQRDNHANKSADHGSSSGHISCVNQTTPESKRTKSNSSHSSKSNWSSSSRQSSHVEYTNISNRFESNAVQSAVRKERSPSPGKFNLTSSNHTENETRAMKQQKISTEFDKNTNPNSNLNSKDEQFKDHIESIQYSPPNAKDYGHEKRKTNTINGNSRYHDDEVHARSHTINSDEDVVVKTTSSSKNSSTKSVQSQVRNSNEYFIKDFTNHKRIPSETTLVNNKANNSHRNDEHKVQTPQISTHQSNVSPTKQNISTRYSPNLHSNNSSPSKSSKSSTSIVIRTNFSTPETEEYSEDALNRELSAELEQLKRYDDEPTDEIEESFVQLTTVEEENLHRDLEAYTRTDHNESSSQTDYEVETRSDAELSYHTDNENSTTSSTSLDDLINMLTPETAYLNLGRSATMMTLKPTKPEFDTNISSFHSTPRHSTYMRRYSSPYDNGQLEKVIFVAELSPMRRSRSPHVSSSFKMADHCNVSHNNYVIK